MATTVGEVLSSTVLYNQNKVAVVSPHHEQDCVLRLFCNDGCAPKHIQQEYDALLIFDRSLRAPQDDSIDFLHEVLNIADDVLVLDVPRDDLDDMPSPAVTGPLEQLSTLQEQFLREKRPLPLKCFNRGMRHAALKSPSPVAIAHHSRVQGRSLREYVINKRMDYQPFLHDFSDYVLNLLTHVGCVLREGLFMTDLSHGNLILTDDFASPEHLGVVLHHPDVHRADEGVLTPWRMGFIDASLMHSENNDMLYPCTTLSTRPLVQFLRSRGEYTAPQTVESLAWLSVECMFARHAAQTGDWTLLEMLVPGTFRYDRAYPTFGDALYAYGTLPRLMARHGHDSHPEYIRIILDSLLRDIARQAVIFQLTLLPYLEQLDDFNLRTRDIMDQGHDRATQINQIVARLKKHHFVTTLRTCYARLIFTGCWDYWKVFERLLPADNRFLRIAGDKARAYLDTHGPVLSCAESGVLVRHCGKSLAQLLLDMLSGTVSDGPQLLRRTLPLFHISRHVFFTPADMAAWAAQKAVQYERGRLADGRKDASGLCILAL